jgi:glycosyltransferase involved in cell wall biosynthesis
MPDTEADSGPIAYLTGEYPKVSHTFIQREVAAVRAAGVEVLTCTVRRAPPRDVLADQKAEEAATFCILAAAKNPATLAGAHLAALARAPGRWLAALALALKTRPPGLKALIYQLFYFTEAGVLAEYLRRKGVRHLHNHFGNSSCSVAMLTSAISGIPYSFTEHGPAIFFEPERWALGEKIARARFVVAISHFCRSQLMLFSDPAHWGKIAIVHCGVDPAGYGQKARKAPGKHVIFVGRLDPVKGALLLLEAFALALKDHPEARLTIVGDGPARGAAEDKARALGLSAAVTFAGYRTQAEVAGLLEEADMLVLPSFAEGVPVVLMEAMASRLPVIASRVAGVSELVEDGVSGFTVPPGDAATLADRIGRLMSGPDPARTMGVAGRRMVEAEFDIAREGAWLAEIFREGGAGGRLRPGAGIGTETGSKDGENSAKLPRKRDTGTT